MAAGLQVPVVARRREPRAAVPRITGLAVFAGAPESTRWVGSEAAVAGPQALVALTATRMLVPTSA